MYAQTLCKSVHKLHLRVCIVPLSFVCVHRLLHTQIGLDTFHWNPIAHIFIWGSILSWLVVIPISSTSGLYGLIGFFQYAGVAFEVIRSATFWFYVPLATIVALTPTIIFRTMRLDFDPHIIDDVRLVQKNEGRKLFKRLKFHRKPADSVIARAPSTKRTGYAYSHTEGYGQMISTGHIFGMNEEEVIRERQKRISMIVSNPASGTGTPTKEPFSPTKAAFVAAGVVSAVVTHGIVTEDREDAKVHVDIHEESKTGDGSSPINEGKLKVNFVDEADENNSSRALLLPGQKDDSLEESEGRGSSVTIEVEEDDPPPVSMNLPGSVESPTSDENAGEDQKALL